MTVVACWIDEAHAKFPGVWCAADGRLGDKATVFADLAPKIGPLPVRCVEFKEREGRLAPYFVHEVGFAFLGHGLTAYQTIASAALVCGQLTHPKTFKGERPIPTLHAIATFVGEVMRQHMLDWRLHWPAGKCSAVVFGFCVPTKRNLVCHIDVRGESPLTVSVTEHEPTMMKPLVLGSGRAELEKLLVDTPRGQRLPVPVLALERMVRGDAKNAVESVGGSPLLGVAAGDGFRHFRVGRRASSGMPLEKEPHEEIQLWDCCPEGFLYRVQELG